MKKVFTFLVIALISSHVNAQSFTPLYHFKDHYNPHSETNLVLTSDKQTLYGHRERDIFRYSLANATFEFIKNAGSTEKQSSYSYEGKVTLSKDQQYLYGIKSSGVDAGAVYRLNLLTLSEEILHQFTDFQQQGYNPMGGLVLDAQEHYLYGVTYAGGIEPGNPWFLGVIYRIALNGTTPVYQALHYFKGDDNGGAPLGSLVLSPDGQYLYGVTDEKGQKGCGTLFKLTLSESNQFPLTTLYSFDCLEEGKPNELVGSADGQFLYGTAYKNYWSNNPGVVFRMNVKTSELTNIHRFVKHNNDGVLPIGITVSQDGKTLYGATQLSGYRAFRLGNIFQISLEDNVFTKLYDFNQEKTTTIVTDMMILDDSKGVLYGMSYAGGLLGKGAIFQLELT